MGLVAAPRRARGADDLCPSMPTRLNDSNNDIPAKHRLAIVQPAVDLVALSRNAKSWTNENWVFRHIQVAGVTSGRKMVGATVGGTSQVHILRN